MTAARERWAWALLFGLPVGVGVSLATGRMARAGLAHPLVAGAGATAAVLLAAFVLAATRVNQT
jgi:hypothetical protein